MSFTYQLYANIYGFLIARQSSPIPEAMKKDNNLFSYLIFKPLTFENPLAEGQYVQLRDYQLGVVERIYHFHDGESSRTEVSVQGGDLGFLLFTSKKFEKIKDLVEKFE